MAIPAQPAIIQVPIAENGDKRAIPFDTPGGSNQLSYNQGFPPITSTPLSAGGIPPQREDFNAVNNLVTQHAFWQQSGLPYHWQGSSGSFPGLNYLVNSRVQASDGRVYTALKDSGPDVDDGAGGYIGPKNPMGDTEGYWTASGAGGGGGGLIELTEPITNFYVSVNGSDENGDGTQATPWRTIQYSIDFIANKYNLLMNRVILNVAPGTYNESIILPQYHSLRSNLKTDRDQSDPLFLILGSGQNTTNINAVHSTNSAATITGAFYAGPYRFKSLKISGGGTITDFIVMLCSYSMVSFSDCFFEQTGQQTGANSMFLVQMLASADFSDSPSRFNNLNQDAECAVIETFGGYIRIETDIAFSGYCGAGTLVAQSGGVIGIPFNQNVNLTGNPIGYRFRLNGLSLLNTIGMGGNAIPGSIAGVIANGSVYI